MPDSTTAAPEQEISLVQAAARARIGYYPALNRVLRGQWKGRQDRRGRWFVAVESVDASIQRGTTSKGPKRAA